MNQITQAINNSNITGVTVKSNLDHKPQYISKRGIDNKMFMPILQEKGKVSYLYDSHQAQSNNRLSDKIVKLDQNSINLSGTKVQIGNNK